MSVLQTLWGLLVDDLRLVSVLFLGLGLTLLLSLLHQPSLGALVVALAIVAALTVSIRHELRNHLAKG